MKEIHFELVVEDDWPPVAVEGVLAEGDKSRYQIKSPPFFIKGISVDDVIDVVFSNGNVVSWSHVSKSNRTTIWLLRLSEPSGVCEISASLNNLGCKLHSLDQLGIYAVDVPGECDILEIDKALDLLDKGKVAVAFPSFRHSE